MVMLIWLHFIADFLLQSDWMAINKSKNSLLGLKAMGTHIGIYTAVFAIVFGWQYALINGLLHLTTDSVTARTTTWLWKKEQRHWFFVVIGLDQAIHMSCLWITFFLTSP
jgi:hypothetical protein